MVLLLSGCGESPRDLRWKLVLGPGVAADRAVGYEAAIVEGGCDGNTRLYEAYAPIGSTFADEPPELGPGVYGFRAWARDAACRSFARGCSQVTLPRPDGTLVRVELEALTEEEEVCSATDRCVDGACVEEDAGPGPDAGPDASVDAGPDAGLDAGVDAGDAGGGCGLHEADCAGTGECVSLLTLTDCGECNTPCVVAHGGESCAAGACAVDGCDDGWEDCDSVVTTGCEAQLGSLAHCGGCYDVCNLANAAEDCLSGNCVLLSCNANHDNCDDIDSNGCEVNLWEDARNCGSCDTVCNAGDTCNKGVCGPPD